jgi:hypothetical protein
VHPPHRSKADIPPAVLARPSSRESVRELQVGELQIGELQIGELQTGQ